MLRISPYSHGGVDEIIGEMQGWAWEFVHHKVIGFEDLDPSETEQKAIMRALYDRFDTRCTECNEAPRPSHVSKLGETDQAFSTEKLKKLNNAIGTWMTLTLKRPQRFSVYI